MRKGGGMNYDPALNQLRSRRSSSGVNSSNHAMIPRAGRMVGLQVHSVPYMVRRRISLNNKL